MFAERIMANSELRCRLEKTIQSNHESITTMPVNPVPQCHASFLITQWQSTEDKVTIYQGEYNTSLTQNIYRKDFFFFNKRHQNPKTELICFSTHNKLNSKQKVLKDLFLYHNQRHCLVWANLLHSASSVARLSEGLRSQNLCMI